MKAFKFILSILFCLINILGVSLYFSFNIDFYINHTSSTQLTNPDLTDLQNAYSFLQNKSNLNDHFTSLEKAHLQDVQNIFSIVRYTFRIALTLFIIIASFLILSKKISLIPKGIFIGSIISLSIILLLLIATTLNFNTAFQSFHNIFFPQGNRTFSEDSRLITLFPESFFISISKSILITSSSISLAIVGIFLATKKSRIDCEKL